MKDHDLMPFGEHKGEKVAEVPANYLLWFLAQPWAGDWSELFDYVSKNRKHLEREVKEERRDFDEAEASYLSWRD